MRFRLKVHCSNCSCDFLITSNYKITESLICPNCKQEAQSEYVEKLHNCVKALQELPDAFVDEVESIFGGKSTFTVEMEEPQFGD